MSAIKTSSTIEQSTDASRGGGNDGAAARTVDALTLNATIPAHRDGMTVVCRGRGSTQVGYVDRSRK